MATNTIPPPSNLDGSTTTSLTQFYRIDGLTIHLNGRGGGQEIASWLGPAVRGWLLGDLKERVCLLNPTERAVQGPSCAGCKRKPECLYGVTWEGTGLGASPAHLAGSEVGRPTWLWTYFPIVNEILKGSLDIPVQIFGVTNNLLEPTQMLEQISMLPSGRIAGMTANWVMDRAKVEYEALDINGLPKQPDQWGGCVPRLAIGLLSPLFLTAPGRDGKKVAILNPSFGDLFRASLRGIGSTLIGPPLDQQIDWRGLKQLALQVETIDSFYEPFEQKRFSSRTDQRYQMRGCVGGAIFRNVPWSLIPWMELGGRLQCGTHRIAGAGRWRLIFEP